MGLRTGDLQELLYNVFEVDSFVSKMGDDSDIVTMSFTVADKEPGEDLVSFLENGYSFILDADITPGEQDDGSYRVFVEMERDKSVPDNIMEIIDGVSKLSDIHDWKFRYYKSFESTPLTLEGLQSFIPLDKETYESSVNESNMNNSTNFFNKSCFDKISINENNLTIKKAYADPIDLKIKAFGKTTDIVENIKEKININDFAEIMFLTKYIGDYNITKFGTNTLTLENQGYALVVERPV